MNQKERVQNPKGRDSVSSFQTSFQERYANVLNPFRKDIHNLITLFLLYINIEQETKQMAGYCSSFMIAINTALNISALHLYTT